jgi:hypothetical protein
VRVPDEAGQGKVRITLSFPDWQEEDVAPVTMEVPLVDQPTGIQHWVH